MGARCFFEGCDINRKNAKEKGVKLLAVPNKRREEWLRAVKREDLLENPKVTKTLFICTRHFKEEHFMAADVTKLKKLCLKPNAIPFILVGDSQSDIAFTDISSSSHNLNSVELVNLSVLSEDNKDLMIAARDARENAYCPYSKFKVGAALRTIDGEIITGCNVENCSYGLAICAERTALVKAVSQNKRHFAAAAVCAEMGDTFVGPCGACRQFFVEFCENMPIFLCRPDLTYKETNSDSLLPDSFNPRWVTFSGDQDSV